MEQHSFGYWLKLKRKALDLTREELAERVGYSAATIRKIEDEERLPSAQVVERLAEFFEIPQSERDSFLRFARGDWKSVPGDPVMNAPWRATHESEGAETKISIVTFLLTDIESSSKLWESSAEKMKPALQRHHEILQEAISSHNGTTFQIVGDAFFAAFPTVQSALMASITAQQRLHQENWDLPFPIRARMGIHTGEAIQISTNPFGGGYESNQTMNRAARILSAGHGGQILLSLATTDLVKDSLPANTELRDMGEHHLRNLIHPEHLFQLNIAGLPTDFPPLNTLTRRHNLPTQLTSFVAREHEIELIMNYLANDDIRLVTLLGPPGIGKTRLSIESARAVLSDFPDGVFFVALAPLDDPSLISQAIAHALGYVGARKISTEEQLKEGIGDKQLLLVLDNCEHLIEDVASLASRLLEACPHIKMIATSRETLRIPGEWLYAVSAFDLPVSVEFTDVRSAAIHPALTLFSERARAVRSDFALNSENIQSITSICAQLDGLPLAIELIAARIRLMSPQSLLQRMSGHFVLTADGMRIASGRQKTLRNAIDWSYNLLPPEEQKLFAYLSVFSGGFTLAAAEAIFSRSVTEKSVPELVALLLDKSLLRREASESSEDRYEMLVTIQEYARERLEQSGEETQARNWHLAYFLELAEQADKEIRGPKQVEWLSRLAAERDNLRSALEWAIETRQTEAALQMAGNLSLFWTRRSDLSEGRQWLGQVVALPDAPQYPKLYSYALAQIAQQTWLQIGAEQARPFLEQALSTARAHGDQWNTAKALFVLGLVLSNEQHFAAAQATLEESERLFQEVHDDWGYAQAMMGLGYNALWRGDDPNTFDSHEQALALFRKIGDLQFQGITLRLVSNVRLKQGDSLLAQATLREALTLAHRLDSKLEISSCLWSLGDAAQRAGNPTRAVRLYWASKIIKDSIGAWREGSDTDFENDLAPCRAALGEEEFAEAVERGRAMTMEQTIAYALEDQG